MFNLSVRGHGECVSYIKSMGVPILLIGGGGYTLRNVPRCWVYETSLATGVEIDDNIPESSLYRSYFEPDLKIHMPVSNMENKNTKEKMEKLTKEIIDNLRKTTAVNVDHSNYRNQGGFPMRHMNFDEKEN